MIASIMFVISAITASWTTYDFLTDPVAIYMVAKKIKNSFKIVRSSPLIVSVEDDWNDIEEWEMIEL